MKYMHSLAFLMVLCWSTIGLATEFGDDILNGKGDFEDAADRVMASAGGPWSFFESGGTGSFATSNPYSGAYHFLAEETVANCDVRLSGSVNHFANRIYELSWAAQKIASSASAYQYSSSGNTSWTAYSPLWSYNSFSANFTQPAADPLVAFSFQMYGDGDVADKFAIDDVTLRCERSIPDPNTDSTVLSPINARELATIVIVCNTGNDGTYNKAFDPDITVTSLQAVIHKVERISDSQVNVTLTPTYGGAVTLVLRNEYSDLQVEYDIAVNYPTAAFTLASDEFPICVMDINANTTFIQNCREAGLDYVQQFALNGDDSVQANIDASLNYLDVAQAAGVKVMLNLRGRKWVVESGGLSSLQQIVQAIKNHPALGFWYLVDEPEIQGVSASQMLPFYNMLHTEAPNIPVANAHCQFYNWDSYSSAEDILMPDHYPVQNQEWPNAPLDQVNDFVDLALGNPDAVMPVLQLHNREVFGDGEDCRYPNSREIRYWCYSTIIQGARGLVWYSYYRGTQVDSSWLPNYFGPVMIEVRNFSVLASPVHEPTVLSDGVNDIYLAVWERDNGRWVVLVNGQNSARQVTVDLTSEISQGYLIPWGMTKPVEQYLDNSSFQINLDPWEVMVWQVSRTADIVEDDYVDVYDLSEMSSEWLGDTVPGN